MKAYKDLYVVRHGESALDNGNVPDIDRPLTEKGVRDAYVIAKRLLGENRVPEKILTSKAARAMHTASIFARVFGLDYGVMHIEKEMYMGATRILMNIIQNTDNKINSIMIFGHNPTFTDLANFFLKDKITNISTNGVVGLKFVSKNWLDLEKTKPLESFYYCPE